MNKIDEKIYYWNKVNVKKVLPLIVEKIKEISSPEKIILFGSYAGGKENKDSDIDLIIVKKMVKSKRQETIKIRHYLKNFIIPMDIIVVKSDEFEFYGKNWINSIFAEAKRNGRIIYEART